MPNIPKLRLGPSSGQAPSLCASTPEGVHYPLLKYFEQNIGRRTTGNISAAILMRIATLWAVAELLFVQTSYKAASKQIIAL